MRDWNIAWPPAHLESLTLREKLAQLEENLRVLSAWQRTLSPESVRKDKKAEWALRYGFFETIQILIDIACHIVSKKNLGKPRSYAECIELLEKEQYLNAGLAERIRGMVGLRNRLVHEYAEVDTARLVDFLSHLDDVRQFVDALKGEIL